MRQTLLRPYRFLLGISYLFNVSNVKRMRTFFLIFLNIFYFFVE